tara:strand:+ start:3209 stop:3778 length:570 start_codon:yes stop_codon:yes gene_type:complete
MKPYLVIVAGLPGTGKQTAAEKIVRSLDNYILIDQNEERRKDGMVKMPIKQDKVMRRTDIMCAKDLLWNQGVVVLAGHRQVVRRSQLYGIASCCGTNAVTLECVCSEEESKRRMKARPPSDGLLSKPRDPKVYNRIAPLWEDISLDFKYPGQDFVSYLRYNSETNNLDVRKLTRGMKGFVDRVEKIITS